MMGTFEGLEIQGELNDLLERNTQDDGDTQVDDDGRPETEPSCGSVRRET